jgi:hypothetical protein
MRTEAHASRGRTVAFRIVGWFFGVGTIVFWLFFLIWTLTAEAPIDRSHRFHLLGGFAGAALIAGFSIVLVMRPGWTAAWHVLVAQALAWLFGGLMGGDLVSGFYLSGPVGLVILGALHPDPRSLLRLPGRPSVALLTYALLCTIPAWIYAVANAELQHGPVSDPHVELHHWSGLAVAALSIAGAALATSLRGEGWRVASAATAAAAVAFGIAGLVFSDYPGAPVPSWSWLAIAAGLGFWILTRIEAAREAPST